jgi:hypothetical protein
MLTGGNSQMGVYRIERRRPMTENQLNQNNLSDELRQLGQNLAAALRLCRSDSGRTDLGEQIASGLSDLASTIEGEAGPTGVSATVQRQELESQYLQQTGPGGQGDTRFETELSLAIRAANASLQEWLDRWTGNQGEEGMPKPDQRQEDRQEVHPDDVASPPRETGHEEVHPDDVESGDTTVSLGE